MTFEQRLTEDMKSAMREKDELRLSVIRMLRGQILLEKKKGTGVTEVPDDVVLGLIRGYAKRVREALDQARAVERADLAVKAEAELKVVVAYLPAPLGEAELQALVAEALAASGVTDVKGIGAVMKLVMERARDRLDGRRAQEAIRRALGSGS